MNWNWTELTDTKQSKCCNTMNNMGKFLHSSSIHSDKHRHTWSGQSHTHTHTHEGSATGWENKENWMHNGGGLEMTTKLFISIPQQRHGEREGTERERERGKMGWSAEREDETGKDTGWTRGERRHVGKIALRTKRRKESTVQQDEKTHRKWIVLSTDGQMRTERVLTRRKVSARAHSRGVHPIDFRSV